MSHETITEALLSALELRDKGSAGHSLRVAELSLRLGHALELSDKDMGTLRVGALLHDIGKIGIPDHILLKPRGLTSEEWAIMKQHPGYGAAILRQVPDVENIIPIIRHHHERWDGMGYPNCLMGETIPFLARICAVAEVFDSLISNLVYRAAWPTAQVLKKMKEEAGKGFDPLVIDALSEAGVGF